MGKVNEGGVRGEINVRFEIKTIMFYTKIKKFIEQNKLQILYYYVLGFLIIYGIIKTTDYLTMYFLTERIEVFKVIIQASGGLLIFFGLILNKRKTEALEKQVNISEDSNVTDRFQKAIEQLGNDNATIRTGGIHSLVRIAEESIKKKSEDWKTIIELFNSFIQNNITNKDVKDYIDQIDFDAIIKHIFFNEFAKVRIDNKIKVEFNNVTTQLFKKDSPTVKQAVFNNCEFTMLEYLSFENCDFNKVSIQYATIINHRNIDFTFCNFYNGFNGKYFSERSCFDKCFFDRIKLDNTNLGDFVDCRINSLALNNCNFYEANFEGSEVGTISINNAKCLYSDTLLRFKTIKKIALSKNLPEHEEVIEKLQEKWTRIEIL